jgi:hypothetical protein
MTCTAHDAKPATELIIRDRSRQKIPVEYRAGPYAMSNTLHLIKTASFHFNIPMYRVGVVPDV